ncbi:MAG: BON domain-containing protein [Betaproteobacteria bacterium]|nr:MAG: BON domain-containing protein [Betaproteobacteria bacterium]
MKFSITSLSVAALIAGTLVLGACNQRSPTTSPSTGSAQPSATDRIANKASDATNKVADKAGEVTNKVAAAADDMATTTKVKTALLAEPGLKSLEISVDTKDGTVTLSGKVDSADQRDRAKQIAQSTGGVKGVVDNLTVKS